MLLTTNMINLCTKKTCPYYVPIIPICTEKYIAICWLHVIIVPSDLLYSHHTMETYR